MNKRKKSKYLTGVLSGLFLLFLALLCFSKVPSFSAGDIAPAKGLCKQIVMAEPKEEIASLHEAAEQTFSFYGEDPDAYFFVSEDYQYVFKFFKTRKLTPKYWLNHIPIPWLNKKRLSKVVDRAKARYDAIGQLPIVFQELRPQTGLIFLHLFKTSYLKAKVRLIDEKGRKKTIDLDEVPFVLRKRVDLVKESVDELYKEGKRRAVIAVLYSIVDFVKKGCKKGFIGYSDLIGIDYGLWHGELLYLGTSSLQKDEEAKTPRATLKEVFRISRAIEFWLQQNYPDLVGEFQEEMQGLLSFLGEE